MTTAVDGPTPAPAGPGGAGASPRAVAERLLAALGSGRVDAVLALLHPEVTWTVPGDAAATPWVGVRRGHEAVRDFFAVVARVAEPRAFTVQALLAEGRDVVALGRFAYHYPGSGRTFEDDFALHLRVEGGLVTRYRIHEDSLALQRAFTGT
jgi:hypothetical protein